MTAWAARGLVGVALLLGLAGLPRAERDLESARRESRPPLRHGVAVLPGIPAETPEMVAHVRRVAPRGAGLRLVNRGGVCRRVAIAEGQAAVYWIQYQILPRSLTCDPAARWSLYLDVPPGPAPPGARARRFGPRLVLVGP